MFNFSKKQIAVVNDVIEWYNTSSIQYITLGGYAGTGKTTILSHISNQLHSKDPDLTIAFCCLTGKATKVLERKLRNAKAIYPIDYIGTIHSLIYKPVLDSKDNIIGWEKIKREDFEYSLLILDESSMISEDVWADLLSFEIPILAVGDHGQLPPIKGRFNLMKNPGLRLEEVFRQDRQNPIIKVSEIARKYGKIPFKNFSNTVKKIRQSDPETQDLLNNIFETFDNSTMILCGYNRTRIKLNHSIRAIHFDLEQPQIGDRVICLKNNRERNIFNGMTGTIQEIYDGKKTGVEYYEALILLDYEKHPFWGEISKEQFNRAELIDLKKENLNYFDYGYALTVHKAQGSEAKRVTVFEERFPKMDDETYARWLYTAVTRAQEELIIIGN